MGVHRDKFYPTGVKGNLDALDKALAKLDISDNISRENVFSEYCDTVQLIFNASTNLSTAVPVFFHSL